MARFDVYPNPDLDARSYVPFFLDVQNDHIRGLETRVVVPLWQTGLCPKKFENLNPEFEVAGQTVVMDTPAIGAVPIDALRSSVQNLANHQLAIQDALDTLFGSY